MKPICLPTQDIVDQEDVFQTTGWGYINSKTKNVPKILQTVSLTLFPLRACQKFYSAHDYTVSSNKQICAKGRNNRDTCDGDSGGPLMTVRLESFIYKTNNNIA